MRPHLDGPRLHDLLEGRLSREELSELREHLATECSDCDLDGLGLDTILRLVEAEEAAPEAPGDLDSHWQGIVSAGRPPRRFWPLMLSPGFDTSGRLNRYGHVSGALMTGPHGAMRGDVYAFLGDQAGESALVDNHSVLCGYERHFGAAGFGAAGFGAAGFGAAGLTPTSPWSPGCRSRG